MLCLAVLYAPFNQAVAMQSNSDAPDTADVDDARADVEQFWPINRILKQAVRNLKRRYSLNDAQTEFTREMMTSRVQKFLEDHHDEIFPMIRDLTWYQQQGSVPDAEAARKMGTRILEMVKLAKEEIYRSNEEWREYLTEDQKRVHDFDMNEMGKTFDQMEGNFQKWAEGKPSPSGIFPQQAPLKNEPAPPTAPKDGSLPTGFAGSGDKIRLDGHFDEYAAKFVKDLRLTPPQVEAANSILRELKHRVSEYTTDNATAIAEIKKNLGEVKSLKERREWKRRQREISKPINVLFAELKDRLDHIPDQAQRDRFKLVNQSTKPAPAASSRRNTRPANGSDGPGKTGGSGKTGTVRMPKSEDKDEAPKSDTDQ